MSRSPVKRLLPQSLGGQLIALLLVALAVSQLASALIFADERRLAIRAAARDQVLLRTASVVRLLEQAPPSAHAQILAAVNSPQLVFSIDDRGLVGPEPPGRLERRLAAALSEMIGDRVETRVRIHEEPGSFFFRRRYWHPGNDDDRRDGWEDHDEDNRRDGNHGPWRHHRLHMPANLALSTQLSDGNWLNGETALPRPPTLWAWPLILSMIIMAVAILAIVTLSVRRITRPLRALAGAAERLGRGEAVPPLAEAGPDEVRRTTAAFNAMQERLTRFLRDRTRMLAAISHDLRTPITSLRLRAEFIEDEEIRGKIVETLEEMSRMTEAALAFMREEAAAEPTRQVDLTALLQSLADDLADMGQDVVFAETAKLPYPCRPVALKRAMRNLVENAVRYGGSARIALDPHPGGPCITIDDDGPGIPGNRLAEVFEPFVRIEESRNQETGGVGLGLAIARTIVRAHGGEVTLVNRREGGLRATISLPDANE